MERKPRGRYWQEFREGEKIISSGRTIECCDVNLFAGLSGDFNPLHVDDEFGRNNPYGSRIAQGLLTLAISSGQVYQTGAYDGTALGLLGMNNVRFPLPVRFGDTVFTECTITGLRPSRSKPDCGIVDVNIEVKNQNGDVVLASDMVLLIAGRTG